MGTEAVYKQWLDAHVSQLRAIELPESLWRRLYQKLDDGMFDAGLAFVFKCDDEERDMRRRWSVYSVRDIEPADDVWLVDHAWDFESPRDGLVQLSRSAPVRTRIAQLLELDGVDDDNKARVPDDGDGDGDGDDAALRRKAEDAVSPLFSEAARIAYPLVVAGRVRHYVMDEVGSRVRQADEATFQCRVFADLSRGEFMSLLWPTRAVPEDSEVTRPRQQSLELMEDGKRYWDLRFEAEDSFDWFCGPEELTSALSRHRSRDDRVLIAGCGNSSLGYDLHAEGYRRVLSVDFSPVVIEKMFARYPELEFACCDCTSMEAHSDGTFGAVIDKGLLDTLLQKPFAQRADEGDTWVLPQECGQDHQARRYISEVHRLLAPGGVLLLVSLGTSRNRVPFFEPQCLLLEPRGPVPGAAAEGRELVEAGAECGDRGSAREWRVLETYPVLRGLRKPVGAGNDPVDQVNLYVITKL